MRLTHPRWFVPLALGILAAASQGRAQTNFTTIVGEPTDHSVTVNVRSGAAEEINFQYGIASGTYTGQTASVTGTADPYATGYYVSSTAIGGLQADTQYYYRMQYRPAGSSGAFAAGAEKRFHTQRLPGSTFVFCIQGDSHPERANSMFNANLYVQTLTAVAAEHPDFYITNGDDFSVDTLPTPYTQPAVTGRYTLQLPYFDILSGNSALFLGTGNHEETSLSNYNLPADSVNSNQVPIWAQNARNLYYPVPGPNDPVTGKFYSGNLTTLPNIGELRDYYAWQWGDALFVVIDPYWASPAQVDTGLGGQNSTTGKTPDKWLVTHGDAQYQWLKQTLGQSTAKWKFIFAHHVMGTGRGGIEVVPLYEWGGNNQNGTYGFPAERPTWPLPIHQLMVANNVTAFFHAHDHLFAHQQLDGITYQELPNPADNTYTAFNADAYLSGDIFPNAGYTKVTVGPTQVKVEYIREWLPQDQSATQVSGTVQFAYTIPASSSATPPTPGQPLISAVTNAASGNAVIAPNTWTAIRGSNLAPAGDTRVWTAADFVGGAMPTNLDGVSVTVNGKPAYVYYISPSQINILTPPDPIIGSTQVQVTANGVTGPAFNVTAQAADPSFFLWGSYVVATHADYSLVGSATLFPGLSTPAKPGETIVLWANGFGPTSTPVVSGSTVQSGTLGTNPVIKIAGKQANVTFAGLVSEGLFQFNVTVPGSTADGDQTITASYGGASTQAGTLLTVLK